MLKKNPSATNIAKVRAILNICDRLHKGGRVKGYKSTDIPSDEKYEELKQLYETVITVDENIIQCENVLDRFDEVTKIDKGCPLVDNPYLLELEVDEWLN